MTAHRTDDRLASPTEDDPRLWAALLVARRFDGEAFACDFGGQTSMNLPNVGVVISLGTLAALPPCDHALDVDDLERAMRAHLLGPGGWPHTRGGTMPGEGPQPIDGCDDICAEAIAREYAAIAAPAPQDPDTGVVVPEPC